MNQGYTLENKGSLLVSTKNLYHLRNISMHKRLFMLEKESLDY